MDVQGARFHLLSGRDDWAGCEAPRADGGSGPLGPEWDAHRPTELEWDGERALRLTRAAPLFRKASVAAPLDLDRRRGAGRDRYGNWYWIDAERRGIRFLPGPARRSVSWWTVDDLSSSCLDAPGPGPSSFVACATQPPADAVLQGLAVTTRHYLVVGWWSDAVAEDRGLFLFDLHQVGRPMIVRWPPDEPFRAWDVASTPRGGVLVLDRVHRTWWELDDGFRLLASVGPEVADAFQPVDPSEPRQVTPGRARLAGRPLATGSPGDLEVNDPVSIEAGPEGTVLVLDSDASRGYSVVHLLEGGTHLQSFSLERAVEVADPDRPDAEPEPYSLLAHDFAYQPVADAGAGPLPPPKLYLADRSGHQVLAFTIDRTTGRLLAELDFLALRRWEAKALVAAGDQVFYDFADRFVALHVFPDCRYHRDGAFTSPAEFAGPTPGVPPVPGQPFDSNRPGCVWHRLFLDAEAPPGTSIAVRARAADDAELLGQTPWRSQPAPYLRSGGCELPWFDPWADAQPTGGGGSLRPGAGTWELLFQGVRGRYLQLEVTLAGTGRSTPSLRALRAWYPRFSYVEHYLPTPYQEEDGVDFFAERWLANFEGLITGVEERLQHVSQLFDARTVPEDSLEWLACWFGIVLDPQWDEARRRFLIRNADALFRARGTLTGVVAMLRLFLDCEIGDDLLDPVCAGKSAGRVRIVESFLTRKVASVSLGDPTELTPAAPATALSLSLADRVAASAHRFSVLVPHGLAEEEQAMVRRIVELNKPGHTQYELRHYWDLFRVGEARLGLDTQLGESARFVPFVVGQTYLPQGYLSAPYPFDVTDRIVSDRDRLGDVPAL